MVHHLSIGERLHAAIDKLPHDHVTLAEIRDLFGRDGLLLLTAFLTIIFLIPVSIPGVSTVFGAAILLAGVSRLLNRDLWLPRRIEQRTVSAEKLRSAMHRGVKWVKRIEKVSRANRMSWVASDGKAAWVNNAAMILGAVLLMAPFGLIPLSNTLPAIALLFLAIGFLQRDGLCVLIGHVANFATIAYFTLLLAGGGVVISRTMKALLSTT